MHPYSLLLSSVPACPGKPSPWEYPGINSWRGPSFLCCFWVNFNDSSCIHGPLWLAFFIYLFFFNFECSDVPSCKKFAWQCAMLGEQMGSFLPPGGMQKWNVIHQTSVCDILFRMVVLTPTVPPTSSVVFPSALNTALWPTQCLSTPAVCIAPVPCIGSSQIPLLYKHILGESPCPWKLNSLGKESGLSSLIAALVMDRANYTVWPCLCQGWCKLTII